MLVLEEISAYACWGAWQVLGVLSLAVAAGGGCGVAMWDLLPWTASWCNLTRVSNKGLARREGRRGYSGWALVLGRVAVSLVPVV